MSHLNWGHCTQRQVASGIYMLNGEGHGGVKISLAAMQEQSALEVLRKYPEIESFWNEDGYYFEEDADINVLFAVLRTDDLLHFLRHLNPDHIQETRLIIAKSLIYSNPDFLAYLNRLPDALLFQDQTLEEVYQNIKAPLHFVSCAFGSWAWDVPEGHVYFTVRDQHKNAVEQGYLVTMEEYAKIKQNLHLPVNTYEMRRFNPNKAMPQYRPDHIDPHTYYAVNSVSEAGQEIVTAYNYAKNCSKRFIMSAMYFQQEKPSQFRFMDEQHSQLPDDIWRYIQFEDVQTETA